jgi:hypothetical protein
MDAPPTQLRPVSSGKFTDWVRRLLVRSGPRAYVTAPPAVHLGTALPVEWRLEHHRSETTLITVSLVGNEIARRRISARTGISTVTETHPFAVLDIDRQPPAAGAAESSGRASVLVPARFVPSLAGRLNEIAWAVSVECHAGATTIFRQEFPLEVLPAVTP